MGVLYCVHILLLSICTQEVKLKSFLKLYFIVLYSLYFNSIFFTTFLRLSYVTHTHNIFWILIIPSYCVLCIVFRTIWNGWFLQTIDEIVLTGYNLGLVILKMNVETKKIKFYNQICQTDDGILCRFRSSPFTLELQKFEGYIL